MTDRKRGRSNAVTCIESEGDATSYPKFRIPYSVLKEREREEFSIACWGYET